MAEYIRKDAVLWITTELGAWETQNRVRELPVEDVQPVKHGYWIEEEPRVLKCSVCGEYAPMNYLGQNCIDSTYCPWCGARMDGEQNDMDT